MHQAVALLRQNMFASASAGRSGSGLATALEGIRKNSPGPLPPMETLSAHYRSGAGEDGKGVFVFVFI